MLDLPARKVVARFDLIGPQPLLLRVGNEPLQLPRRIALVIDVVLAVDPLNERELVLRIDDLKELWHVRSAVMHAQHPIAQAVERSDPHPAEIRRCQRGEPRQHFLGRLVGKRDGEDRQRVRLARRQQPRDSRGENARLATAGPCENERRGVGQRDGGELLGIEPIEKRRRHSCTL